jgi:hypothetical protein
MRDEMMEQELEEIDDLLDTLPALTRHAQREAMFILRKVRFILDQ